MPLHVRGGFNEVAISPSPSPSSFSILDITFFFSSFFFFFFEAVVPASRHNEKCTRVQNDADANVSPLGRLSNRSTSECFFFPVPPLLLVAVEVYESP